VRAGRLLTLLLVLQEQGRTTTAALAARLEVSRRTVLRDLSALGAAGVPIVTWAGPGGGVELLDGWATVVATLVVEPSAGLWLAGHPLLARAVGLSAAETAVRTASLAALPDAARREAVARGNWLVVDPEPAPGHEVAPALLVDAARCCREGLALIVTTTAGDERVLLPDQLILRRGRWWLAERDDGPLAAQFALDTVQSHRLGPRPARTSPVAHTTQTMPW
jgi:predicted DNA-binding transcriptional regulator YafY